MTIADRIKLAKKLREKDIPHGPEYIRTWISFNTFYDQEPDRSERERAMNSIRHNLKESQADALLTELSDAITFFTTLPVANTRLNPADLNFRKASKDNLDLTNDKSQPSLERLASLISVLYQVRCNLMHGDKDPDNQRDQDVVSWSLSTLTVVTRELY